MLIAMRYSACACDAYLWRYMRVGCFPSRTAEDFLTRWTRQQATSLAHQCLWTSRKKPTTAICLVKTPCEKADMFVYLTICPGSQCGCFGNARNRRVMLSPTFLASPFIPKRRGNSVPGGSAPHSERPISTKRGNALHDATNR